VQGGGEGLANTVLAAIIRKASPLPVKNLNGILAWDVRIPDAE
jgi:hypothetical protein